MNAHSSPSLRLPSDARPLIGSYEAKSVRTVADLINHLHSFDLQAEVHSEDINGDCYQLAQVYWSESEQIVVLSVL